MDQPTPTIRILRPGRFTSVEGKTVTFGAPELQAIADGYDADSDPAPLVIGHPKIEDQAWGWVGRLAVENGELVAHPDTIEASFAERVRRRDYAKVSAQLYEPGNPHNPKPGSWYLKHVGFLGAHAPGVKGLGTVAFAEAAPGATATIETPPKEKEAPVAEEPNANTDAARLAEREAALAQREAAAEAREAQARKDAAAARHTDNVSFAEGLVAQAKLAPAGKDLLIGALDSLGHVALPEGETISFGEAAPAGLTPATALRKLFDGAVPLVSFGEAAPRQKPGAGTASFAAPAGYTVDPAQDALYAEAKRIQAGAPQRPFMDCVRDAQAGLQG